MVLDLEFLQRACRINGRNFKSTTLGSVDIQVFLAIPLSRESGWFLPHTPLFVIPAPAFAGTGSGGNPFYRTPAYAGVTEGGSEQRNRDSKAHRLLCAECQQTLDQGASECRVREAMSGSSSTRRSIDAVAPSRQAAPAALLQSVRQIAP